MTTQRKRILTALIVFSLIVPQSARAGSFESAPMELSSNTAVVSPEEKDSSQEETVQTTDNEFQNNAEAFSEDNPLSAGAPSEDTAVEAETTPQDTPGDTVVTTAVQVDVSSDQESGNAAVTSVEENSTDHFDFEDLESVVETPEDALNYEQAPATEEEIVTDASEDNSEVSKNADGTFFTAQNSPSLAEIRARREFALDQNVELSNELSDKDTTLTNALSALNSQNASQRLEARIRSLGQEIEEARTRLDQARQNNNMPEVDRLNSLITDMESRKRRYENPQYLQLARTHAQDFQRAIRNLLDRCNRRIIYLREPRTLTQINESRSYLQTDWNFLLTASVGQAANLQPPGLGPRIDRLAQEIRDIGLLE